MFKFYGIYLSQLIRYTRVCDSYNDALVRTLLLNRKLPKQRYQLVKLKSSLRKLVNRCDKYVANDHGYLMFVVIVNHKNNISMEQPDIKYRTTNLALQTTHISFLKIHCRFKPTMQMYSIIKLMFQNTEPFFYINFYYDNSMYKSPFWNLICYVKLTESTVNLESNTG